jgi:hypothetical protein
VSLQHSFYLKVSVCLRLLPCAGIVAIVPVSVGSDNLGFTAGLGLLLMEALLMAVAWGLLLVGVLAVAVVVAVFAAAHNYRDALWTFKPINKTTPHQVYIVASIRWRNRIVAIVIGNSFTLITGVGIVSRIRRRISNPLSSSLIRPSEVLGHGEIVPLLKGSWVELVQNTLVWHCIVWVQLNFIISRFSRSFIRWLMRLLG